MKQKDRTAKTEVWTRNASRAGRRNQRRSMRSRCVSTDGGRLTFPVAWRRRRISVRSRALVRVWPLVLCGRSSASGGRGGPPPASGQLLRPESGATDPARLTHRPRGDTAFIHQRSARPSVVLPDLPCHLRRRAVQLGGARGPTRCRAGHCSLSGGGGSLPVIAAVVCPPL